MSDYPTCPICRFYITPSSPCPTNPTGEDLRAIVDRLRDSTDPDDYFDKYDERIVRHAAAHLDKLTAAAAAPPPAVGKPFSETSRRALDTARWSGL